VPAGMLSSAQLGCLQQVAELYGEGRIHLTTRQGVEIPGVPLSQLEEVRRRLADVGLAPGSCGPRVRNILSCPGTESCGHGLGDARGLALTLDTAFVGKSFPVKIKMAVAGCPNSCTTPQVNDVGFVAAVEPRFKDDLCLDDGLCEAACKEGAITMQDGKPVWHPEECIYCGECIAVCPTEACTAARSGFLAYLGGKVGRHPQLGVRFGEFYTEDEAVDLAAAMLEFVQQHGEQGERLGSVLNRTGIEALEQFLGERREPAVSEAV
jgi:anaerobic sulfite reductase subunit C